jgi:uncharacterized protein YeaO (DUF488 family)
MEVNERFDRLDTFISEGRITRRNWGDGQSKACLLFALVPEGKFREHSDFGSCPASVLPPWMAQLTVSIDDKGSTAAWADMIKRYACVVRRGALSLDGKAWERVKARFLIAALKEAEPSDKSGCCISVADLWKRSLAGNEPTSDEWTNAVAAAGKAAREVFISAGKVPYSKYCMEYSAAYAAQDAATASRTAEETHPVVDAMTVCRAATYATANEAAWDRMTEALFQAIETEFDLTLIK